MNHGAFGGHIGSLVSGSLDNQHQTASERKQQERGALARACWPRTLWSYCVGVTFQDEGLFHAHTSHLGPDANTIPRNMTWNEKRTTFVV